MMNIKKAIKFTKKNINYPYLRNGKLIIKTNSFTFPTKKKSFLKSSLSTKNQHIVPTVLIPIETVLQPPVPQSQPIASTVQNNNEFKQIFKNNFFELIPNSEPFLCGICNLICPIEKGIVLQECLHQICCQCLRNTLMDEAIGRDVKCFNYNCSSYVLDREKRGLLSWQKYCEYNKRTLSTTQSTQLFEEFERLKEFDDKKAIFNNEPVQCNICYTNCQIGEAMILRNCLHICCKRCVSHVAEFSVNLIVKCPYQNVIDGGSCVGIIEQREIREVMNEQQFQRYFNRYEQMSLQSVTGSNPCYATPNCPGIWIQELLANGEKVTSFLCSICKQWNCTICKIGHAKLKCIEYKNTKIVNTNNILLNKKHIQDLKIARTAMSCPHCGVTVIKTFGCDKMICPLCKKQFIWYPLGH